MSTRVVIGEVRFSYAHLLKPHKDKFGNGPKYSVVVLIPKSNTASLASVQSAIAAAQVAKWGGKIPLALQQSLLPLKDGDTHVDQHEKPLGEECRGMWVLRASTEADRPPKIVDTNYQPILDPTAIYSGMWGYIALNFAGYDSGGNRGVSAYISTNVMKTRDGEPLGNAAPAPADDFAGIAVASAPAPGTAPNMANFGFGMPSTPTAPNPNLNLWKV